MNIFFLRKRLLFIWTVLLLLFRPSILGERFNPVIYFLFIIVTGLLFLLDPESKKRYMDKRVIITFLLILLTILYFLFQGLLLSSAKSTVINSFVVILGASICIAYVSRKENVPQIFKAFITIFFWLSVTAVITAVIFIFCGLEASKIPVVANLSYLTPEYIANKGGSSGSHLLFFPFTLVWSSINIAGIDFPRFVGIFREPGMAQLFFLTAYFLTYFVEVKRVKLKRSLILMGAILTFSTGGLLSFLGGFLMLKLFGKGKVPDVKVVSTTVVSLSIILIVFATIPQLGFLNKASSQSGKERSKSYMSSLKLLAESPVIGTGYYNDFIKNKKDKAVASQFLGILGVAYQIGIVGLILYSIVWYYGLSRLGNLQTFCIYMPCLLTLLISQPSYNDVIVFFLILTDTSTLTMLRIKNRVISSEK